MSILIITCLGDAHADAVRWGLERIGRTCRRWLPDTLDASPASTWLGDDEMSMALSSPDGAVSASDLGAVWLRRIGFPELPAWMPHGDRVVSRRETDRFLRGAMSALPAGALWANAPAAQRRAEDKVAQLLAARRVGLRVPRTLVSNDAAEVRRFLAVTRGDAIYKGFLPAVWTGDARQAVLGTAVVREEDLADDDALRWSPGIFQERVPKACELRVTIFGRTCIAARIAGGDEIDWRSASARARIEPHALAPEVEDKVLALMDELGLAMGSLDLIVTPDGEHVFLEINEQGQFLWAEDANPDIALLEPCIRFFASADRHFRWDGRRDGSLGFRAYLESASAAALRERELPRASSAGVSVPDAIG